MAKNNFNIDDLYSNPSQGNPASKPAPENIVQQGSDLFRSLGLGAIPTIASSIYEGGRAISSALGNKNAYINQQTGQEVQDPFSTDKELNQFSTPQGAAIETLKNTAGAASYAVPETKIIDGTGLISHLLGGVVNKGVQGVFQGGLNAVSQGQNPVLGAITGAVTNPALAGIGNIATDILPRYIGLRNFGAIGTKLPEVVKAENAAGDQSLQDVRNTILRNVKPFTIQAEATPGDPQNRFSLMNKIEELSKQPSWDGTPGLSELKKTSSKTLPVQVGILADIQKAIQNSDTPFDAYNKIKNMAYSTENTPAGNRLANFLKSAAGTAREHLIESSDNPSATRNAMDTYAAQTAMGGAVGRGGNKFSNLLTDAARGGGGEAGVAALATLFPALHGVGIAGLADTAITNSVTGPPLARTLVNIGEKAGSSGMSNFLKRLGISATQNLINGSTQ